MSKSEEGAEKKVTFYKGTPEEKTVELHDTGHENVGAHKGAHGAYGVAAITERLKGMDFPLTKRQVLDRLASQEIQWSKDRKLDLRVIFDRLPERFESPIEIVEAISENLEPLKKNETL